MSVRDFDRVYREAARRDKPLCLECGAQFQTDAQAALALALLEARPVGKSTPALLLPLLTTARLVELKDEVPTEPGQMFVIMSRMIPHFSPTGWCDLVRARTLSTREFLLGLSAAARPHVSNRLRAELDRALEALHGAV